jgi:hypothetical protein
MGLTAFDTPFKVISSTHGLAKSVCILDKAATPPVHYLAFKVPLSLIGTT